MSGRQKRRGRKRAKTFFDILKALNRAQVRYLVAGGVAVNLHGVPRLTHDLDLYVDLERENVLRIIRALTRLGFQPRIPEPPERFADPDVRRHWIKDKGMLVFNWVDPDNPIYPVDIFVEHRIPFEEAWKRRKRVSAEGEDVPLLSVDHLILLKRKAGRRQDLADIDSLKRL